MCLKNNYFLYIIIGLILYNLCGVISLFFSLANYVKMVACLVMIYGYIKSPKYKLGSLSISYGVFTILTAFMVFRGSLMGNFYFNYELGTRIDTPYGIIRNFLISPNSALALFIPFVFLLRFELKNLKYIKISAFFGLIISILMLATFSDSIFSSINSSGMTLIQNGEGEYLSVREFSGKLYVCYGAIVLMSFWLGYFNKLIYWLFPLLMVLHLVTSIMGGGRGGTFSSALYLLVFIWLYYKNTNVVSKKMSNILFGRLLIVFFSTIVVYKFVDAYNNGNQMFDFFIKRMEDGGDLYDNNRTEYVNEFVKDFNEHPLAWVFGRGVNGLYRCHGSWRASLEWGYLWLILKGGILYLASYVFILLKSFYVGYFKSHNLLCKGFAMLVLLQVYSLLPFGIPTVSMQFFLVWLGVGIINKPGFLSLSDKEVKKYF